MQRQEQLPSCTYDYADPGHRPFAVFKLKYRSAEALRARGLVPRGAAKHERSASSSQVEERPAKRQDRSGKGDNDNKGGDDDGGDDEGDDDKGGNSLVLAFRPRR
jgi:hypothetical protein